MSLPSALLDQHYMLVPRPASDTPASSSSSPPIVHATAEQKASMIALPASTRGKIDRKKMGKFVAKVFNPQASRPQPMLRTPFAEFKACMTYTATLVTTSTTLPVFASAYITLNSFPDYTSYTSLFDEYKCEQVEAWLEPSLIMSPSVGSCMFYSAVDIDDANTPVAYADVSDRQGAIASETGTGHYHKWKPSVANALYSGAFTSYGSEPAPWIDCASTTVQHYGLKAATNAADGVVRVYYVTYRALWAFRGPAI